MPHVKSCGAIIFRREDDKVYYLLVRHVGESDYWGFVKGIVEDDETEIDTAVREIQEETGIEDLKFKDCFRGTERYSPEEGVTKDAVYFLAETSEKEIRLALEELDKYEWLEFEDALERLKHPSQEELLKKAEDRMREESEKKR